MKYSILGADGKVYGPVSFEQVRSWLAEGRLESRTPVHVQGAPAWTTLAALPEFATPAASRAPALGPLPPSSAVSRTNGFATAALVFGILSWACCCCQIFPILGLVFAIVALVQIHSQPQRQEGQVFAIIGLVLCGANLVLGIIAAILQLAFGNNSVSWNFNGFQ